MFCGFFWVLKNYLLSSAFFLLFRWWPFVKLSVNNCPLKFVGLKFNLSCLFWMFLFSMALFGTLRLFALFGLALVLALKFWIGFFLDGVGDDEIKVLLLTGWWIFNVDGFFLPLTGNVLLFERECFFVEEREARNIQIFVWFYKSNHNESVNFCFFSLTLNYLLQRRFASNYLKWSW